MIKGCPSGVYHVEIQNHQRQIALCPETIEAFVRRVLCDQRVREASISLVVTTDRSIRVVNRRFLNHDYATDVLTFDLADTRSGRKGIEAEILVSAVTARRQAREIGSSVYDELALYIVHGVLHLVGYDDHCPADAARMRQAEQTALSKAARELKALSYGDHSD